MPAFIPEGKTRQCSTEIGTKVSAKPTNTHMLKCGKG